LASLPLGTGTKKPIRIFFAPMLIPDKVPDASMFFAYKKADAKLPHALVLSKAPDSTLVACGIWSQHQFFSRLLSLSPAIDFSIAELNYEQSSLSRCFATAVATDLGRPVQPLLPQLHRRLLHLPQI